MAFGYLDGDCAGSLRGGGLWSQVGELDDDDNSDTDEDIFHECLTGYAENDVHDKGNDGRENDSVVCQASSDHGSNDHGSSGNSRDDDRSDGDSKGSAELSEFLGRLYSPEPGEEAARGDTSIAQPDDQPATSLTAVLASRGEGDEAEEVASIPRAVDPTISVTTTPASRGGDGAEAAEVTDKFDNPEEHAAYDRFLLRCFDLNLFGRPELAKTVLKRCHWNVEDAITWLRDNPESTNATFVPARRGEDSDLATAARTSQSTTSPPVTAARKVPSDEAAEAVNRLSPERRAVHDMLLHRCFQLGLPVTPTLAVTALQHSGWNAENAVAWLYDNPKHDNVEPPLPNSVAVEMLAENPDLTYDGMVAITDVLNRTRQIGLDFVTDDVKLALSELPAGSSNDAIISLMIETGERKQRQAATQQADETGEGSTSGEESSSIRALQTLRLITDVLNHAREMGLVYTRNHVLQALSSLPQNTTLGTILLWLMDNGETLVHAADVEKKNGTETVEDDQVRDAAQDANTTKEDMGTAKNAEPRATIAPQVMNTAQDMDTYHAGAQFTDTSLENGQFSGRTDDDLFAGDFEPADEEEMDMNAPQDLVASFGGSMTGAPGLMLPTISGHDEETKFLSHQAGDQCGRPATD